jgi:PHD/YefM family antitoxin component YafN of YafNO toxin-antitoxin module
MKETNISTNRARSRPAKTIVKSKKTPTTNVKSEKPAAVIMKLATINVKSKNPIFDFREE